MTFVNSSLSSVGQVLAQHVYVGNFQTQLSRRPHSRQHMRRPQRRLHSAARRIRRPHLRLRRGLSARQGLKHHFLMAVGRPLMSNVASVLPATDSIQMCIHGGLAMLSQPCANAALIPHSYPQPFSQPFQQLRRTWRHTPLPPRPLLLPRHRRRLHLRLRGTLSA